MANGLNFPGRISILVNWPNADVAELVDAQVSEACPRERVEVRFFSSAPNLRDEGRGPNRLRPFSLLCSCRRCVTLLAMRSALITSLEENQPTFGITLTDDKIG